MLSVILALTSGDPSLNLRQLPREMSLDVEHITMSACYHELPIKQDDVTVTRNTDCVSILESSTYSIWPLLLQINELNPKDRVKHVLLAGLRFRSTKPNMNCILRPIVTEINDLSSNGVAREDSEGNKRTTRVFPRPCTIDSVARALVMNMKKFNGAYGCGWCQQKGEVVQKGSGHSRVYSALVPKPVARTDFSFRENATKAETSKQTVWHQRTNCSFFPVLHYIS